MERRGAGRSGAERGGSDENEGDEMEGGEYAPVLVAINKLKMWDHRLGNKDAVFDRDANAGVKLTGVVARSVVGLSRHAQAEIVPPIDYPSEMMWCLATMHVSIKDRRRASVGLGTCA